MLVSAGCGEVVHHRYVPPAVAGAGGAGDFNRLDPGHDGLHVYLGPDTRAGRRLESYTVEQLLERPDPGCRELTVESVALSWAEGGATRSFEALGDG